MNREAVSGRVTTHSLNAARPSDEDMLGRNKPGSSLFESSSRLIWNDDEGEEGRKRVCRRGGGEGIYAPLLVELMDARNSISEKNLKVGLAI